MSSVALGRRPGTFGRRVPPEVAEPAHRWCENVRLAGSGCGWQAEGRTLKRLVGTGVRPFSERPEGAGGALLYLPPRVLGKSLVASQGELLQVF